MRLYVLRESMFFLDAIADHYTSNNSTLVERGSCTIATDTLVQRGSSLMRAWITPVGVRYRFDSLGTEGDERDCTETWHCLTRVL